MDNKLPDPQSPTQPLPATPFSQTPPPPDPYDKVSPVSQNLGSQPIEPESSTLPPNPTVNPVTPPTDTEIPVSNAPNLENPLKFQLPSEPPEPSQIQPSGGNPPPPPMDSILNANKPKKGLPKGFIIAMIVAILLGGGGAYYISTIRNTSSTPEQPKTTKAINIPTPTATPSVTLVPTENSTPTPTLSANAQWKIYKGSQFTLNYPVSWSITENTNQYGSIKFYDPKKTIPGGIGDISVTLYSSSLSLNQWLASGHPVFGKDLQTYYTVKQSSTIGSNPVSIMTGGTGSTYGKVAYLKEGGTIFELFLQGTAATINQAMTNDDVFLEMLNSLKSSTTSSE